MSVDRSQGHDHGGLQRRRLLQAGAAWAATAGYASAQVQPRSNVVERQGEVLVNGQPLRRGQTVVTGDTVQTGPGSHLVFMIGDSAFQLRQDTRLVIERGNSINTVGLLRLHSGGLLSAWGPGQRRQIVTPTLSASLRGPAGLYVEIPAYTPDRTYLCTCYGEVTLTSGIDRIVAKSFYHQAYWADGRDDGTAISSAQFINHTDEEVEYLAMLIGQKTAWQLSGAKGVAPKSGYPGLPESSTPGTLD